MSFELHQKRGLVWLASPNIGAPHAFTTRFGGVSRGIYESLNLAENRRDDPAAVRENFRRLSAALDFPDRFAFTRQVHGTVVRAVGRSDLRSPYDPPAPDSDGLITDEPGVPLIIFTADCIPILLHDPVRGAVGAVHAGWRGTAAGIAGIAVRRMAEEYGCRPENVRAAIGPGISKCCFETDSDVPEALRRSLGAEAEAFIAPGKTPGKYFADLPAANARFLELAGLLPGNIALSGICTMCCGGMFWSHRGTRGQRGVQASVVMLKGNA